MPAGSYSTDIIRGDTFRRTFTFYQTAIGGTVVNLTGATFAMVMDKVDDLTTVYTLTSYIASASPSSGVAVLTVPASVTANMVKGRYRYYLRVTDSGGSVKTYLTGTIDVTEVP